MADKDLDSADYVRFIQSKGGHPKCPLCQTDGWSFINETNGESYGFPITSRTVPDITSLRTSHVALLTCKNCGFIAPILREKLERELGDENG